MPPLFDAGVPLEALPWGVEGDAPISSRRFRYKAEDGETDLEAYFAWDPSLLEGGDGGLPGVLVAHTAIGPQEVFVHTCCDALARMGFAAFALDAFGAGKCVFDKAERDALFGALRVDRTRHARRILKAYEALIEQPRFPRPARYSASGSAWAGWRFWTWRGFGPRRGFGGWSRSTEASTDLR
jgi:dienelactone hydrolase